MNLSAVIRSLMCSGWYWGKMSYDTAIDKLSECKDGTFLLRDSADDHHLFTLAIKCHGEVINLRVHFAKGSFSLDSVDYLKYPSPTFTSVCDLVEYYRQKRCSFYIHIPNSHLQNVTVSLRYPCFMIVPSLKHICRQSIFRHLKRAEDALKLDLPYTLKHYLQEY